MTFAWWHLLVLWLPILPNFWSIWHIWNHDFLTWQKKMTWLLIAIFVPVVGGLLYIFIGRRQALPKI